MSRNYSCTFALSESLAAHYASIVHAFNTGEPFSAPYPDIASARKPHLEIFVKKHGTFSSFMHELPTAADSIQNDFQILGPFV